MRNVMAPNKNIRALVNAFNDLENRGPGIPGIGLVTGKTGAGKTMGLDWLVGMKNAVYLRARCGWSLNSMLVAGCVECRGERLSSNAAMIDFIAEFLATNQMPMFIDEADYLAGNARMLETIRDIHDISRMPVLLVGMEGFERKIVHHKQFDRRVHQRVVFRPLDLEDTRNYVDTVCEVKVADDLMAKLHEETDGSIGHMAVGVSHIESYAKKQGLTEIGLKEWGSNRPITSSRPARGKER